MTLSRRYLASTLEGQVLCKDGTLVVFTTPDQVACPDPACDRVHAWLDDSNVVRACS